MSKSKIFTVQDTEVRIQNVGQEEYICLTDMAKKFNAENPSVLIINWMRTLDTLEFLKTWEVLNGTDFNHIEFDKIKNEAGTNRFTISVGKWTELTNAVGIVSKSGRYGSGTFAHQDIAIAFGYWLSPTFQLYLIKEFQRLQKEEKERLQLEADWNVKRMLSKINYRFHTDAIRHHLVPPKLENTKAEGLYFASEADLLNLAVFGITAKEWRDQNPNLKGNMRDNASTEQLLVLANLENLNAEFIRQNLDKEERLMRLNEIAIYQLHMLLKDPSVKLIN